MNNVILFDAAVQRIFGEYLNKEDILNEVNALSEFLKKNPNYLLNNDEGKQIVEHLAFLDTIRLAMLEKLK